MSSGVTIRLQWLEHGLGLQPPGYATQDAAGMDVRAATPADGPVTLKPGERVVIETGFCLALPAGYEAQIRPRSGLAAQHGVTCLNTPGTIDADYRGEVKVILINLGADPFTVNRGDRIAQMVISPVTRASIDMTELLDQTPRGEGGFGSTGRT